MFRTRRAVVVLPLVPVTSRQPWPSSRARRAAKPGATASAMRPGKAVPPPKPRRRLRAAASLAVFTAAAVRTSATSSLDLLTRVDKFHQAAHVAAHAHDLEACLRHVTHSIAVDIG